MNAMTIATAKRFTVDEYHRLADLGFLTETDRVELIWGEIIEMAAKGRPHATCCSNLLRELAVVIAGQAELRCQDPIVLPVSNSEPEPDLVIVRKKSDNYLSAHPHPSDVLLVIEISDSTLKYDREVKLSLYAEAGISDYWIFNLVDYRLETHSEPLQDLHGKFDYAVTRIFLPNQIVVLPGFSDLFLDLSRIFPTILD
jgi:Uma2 family endonuclease